MHVNLVKLIMRAFWRVASDRMRHDCLIVRRIISLMGILKVLIKEFIQLISEIVRINLLLEEKTEEFSLCQLIDEI